MGGVYFSRFFANALYVRPLKYSSVFDSTLKDTLLRFTGFPLRCLLKIILIAVPQYQYFSKQRSCCYSKAEFSAIIVDLLQWVGDTGRDVAGDVAGKKSAQPNFSIVTGICKFIIPVLK